MGLECFEAQLRLLKLFKFCILGWPVAQSLRNIIPIAFNVTSKTSCNEKILFFKRFPKWVYLEDCSTISETAVYGVCLVRLSQFWPGGSPRLRSAVPLAFPPHPPPHPLAYTPLLPTPHPLALYLPLPPPNRLGG